MGRRAIEIGLAGLRAIDSAMAALFSCGLRRLARGEVPDLLGCPRPIAQEMTMLAALLIAPAATAAPIDTDRSAIFTAAGFARRGADWRTKDCEGMEGDSYTPGTIDDYRDVNGDGRPDAMISEGSGICYGNTGMRFWLLSKAPSGKWTVMASEVASPELLKTKGAGGWPDILLGGPGFCFPVMRWNGKAYVGQRNEYEGKPCKP